MLTQKLLLSACRFIANGIGADTTDNLFPQYSSAGGAIYLSATAQSTGSRQFSDVTDCFFSDNYVYGGGGGAMYAVSAGLRVSSCLFEANRAYSSYTFKAQGGAVMSAKVKPQSTHSSKKIHPLK